MIKAVIFDMDGILIDSEPFWCEAQTNVFRSVGVDFSQEMCRETTGIRVDQVVSKRYRQFRWDSQTPEQVEQSIISELERLILAKGEPMTGVHYIIDFFRKRKFRLALASSTHLHVIHTVLKKLELEDTFEVIHSAQFEEHGKPHPAIYLTTLKKLGLQPQEAIAFEDSLYGLIAAKAAMLKTIAIPDKHRWHETRFDFSDLKLRSLAEFNEAHLTQLSKA